MAIDWMVTRAPRKRVGESSPMSRGIWNGQRATSLNRLGIMLTKRRNCSSDTDTPSEDDPTGDHLSNREPRANDDGSDDEADVTNCEDPFTTDSIGQGSSNEGAHQSANGSTRRNPSKIKLRGSARVTNLGGERIGSLLLLRVSQNVAQVGAD